ncbi:hypothetical protein LSCM1_03150 [Leishmania martiniquensis]|uniref:J domain-containing protein n=1 Tax=Leishmania martiniquensis TaxID=1580590 RepID=A0A836HCI9_9TRYP|nr:hypothetical protein LSCM1_03150 [Leishmania martiniquensis]
MESEANAPPHYECLGVAPSISAADLARHYKKLSLQLHPDRAAYRKDASNEAQVQARYQRITEAYAVLSDPEKRNAYDTKHGVNFQSRLAHVQSVIAQHNTMAIQRTAMERATDTAVSSTSATTHPQGAEDSLVGPQKNAAKDTDVDDDEDYDPNEVAAPPCDARRRGGSSGSHSANMSDEDEAGDYITRLFGLQLRTGAEAAARTCGGLPMTKYEVITLTRSSVPAVSPHARTWGLILEKNVLVGLAADEPELLESIAGIGAVPFPTVVQQVNDVMVKPTTDLPHLLYDFHNAASSRMSAVSPGTGQPAPTNDEADSCEGVQPSQACVEASTGASAASSTEHLRLVLAYSTVAYNLVGEVHLLEDDDVISRLVPSWCVAPQIRPLVPDASVLSVNGLSVRSVQELRAALRSAVLDGRDEDAMQAMKRLRTSRAVVVECCQLPFL